MGDHWREWVVPGSDKCKSFTSSGTSSMYFDVYTFDKDVIIRGGFWARIRGGRLQLMLMPAGLGLSSVVATCSVPDTLDEAVAWLRLAAACHGGDHG